MGRERLTARRHDIVLLRKDGQLRTPMELSGQETRMVMERLAEYEDAAELQEKGCRFCSKWSTPTRWVCVPLTEDGEIEKSELGNDLAMYPEVCPVCGRKLV